MSVSKRTRFEVLRRDNHTCHYCGAKAPDVVLHVDHVVPTSLGGSDDASNLVAACRDCNLGKASTSPASEMVDEVDAQALRWAAAMQRAAEIQREQHDEATSKVEQFHQMWLRIGVENGYELAMIEGWQAGIERNLRNGLTLEDMEYAAKVALTNSWVDRKFAYFMGVCREMLDARADLARKLLEAEGKS